MVDVGAYEQIAIGPLVLGIVFMMLGVNGPVKKLRRRREGIPTEGTIVDVEHAPAAQFKDHKGRTHGWDHGGWRPVYSYKLADGKMMTSSATALEHWEKRKEDVVIGKKMPLIYRRSDPSKISRGDRPTFDFADCLVAFTGFVLIAGTALVRPVAAGVALLFIALYFGWRSGHFAGEGAQ